MLEMAADQLASSETYYLHNINFVKMNYLLFDAKRTIYYRFRNKK